ncbi:MAG: nucleotidyltransferase family protein, partial [Eubacterium sp.]|nr:nucleotidyltransferase family protein [Eubacterium sp.]
MNNLQTTIFILIDAALHQKTDANITLPEDTDWNEIEEELSAQSVLGIPLDYMVHNVDAPKEIIDQWTLMVYSQVAQWTKLMEEQTKLVELLNQNNIPTAIIKGAAAAMNYPKVEYRSMGDIDFVVKDEDYKKAFELLRANGYGFATDESKGERHVEDEKFYHVELKKGDIVFELHRRMSDTAQGKDIDQIVDNRIKEGMNHIQTGRVGNYEFPMFEKKLNGLIILRHIIQHLSDAKGVGLRHVIDWMTFVEENVDDAFWQ